MSNHIFMGEIIEIPYNRNAKLLIIKKILSQKGINMPGTYYRKSNKKLFGILINMKKRQILANADTNTYQYELEQSVVS